MPRIAIIDKYQSKVNYKDYFDFDFDMHFLVNSNMKKVLKKDVTLEIDLDIYDFVILVGAECAKHVANITGILKYQGYLLKEKFLPLTNPRMLRMRPEGQPAFDNALVNITRYINNEIESLDALDIRGISDRQECFEYFSMLIADSSITHIALDTETTCLYPRDGYVLGLSITHKENQGVYISSDILDDDLIDMLQVIVTNKIVIFHNAKFDMKMLEYHFSLVFNKYTDAKHIEDTMLLHYCLDENKGTHDLKQLSVKYTKLGDYDLELNIFKDEYCKKHGILKREFTYDLIPFDILWPYAAIDTLATFKIYHLFKPKVLSNPKINWVYINLLLRGTYFLVKVEENGVPFDKDRLVFEDARLQREISSLKKSIYDFDEIHRIEAVQGTIFNPGSNKQLQSLFFDYLNLPPTGILTDSGEHSVNAEVLELLSNKHPIAEVIHKVRKTSKIRNTYTQKVLLGLDMDQRLRTGFNLTSTTSGRLSSSGKLNMQQLPRKDKTIKYCISAKKGHKIVSQDLGTAEMYIAAVLSGDKVLQKIFVDKQDYHGTMAVYKYGLPCTANEVAELYPDERQDAKTISFEILYKLNYNEPALENFKVLKRWLKSNDKYIRENGFIFSLLGRKRRLPNVFSTAREIVNHEVRSGINFLVQSVASDINLMAAMEMQDYIDNHGMKSKIFALVHDSILAEVPDEEIEEYSKVLKEITQRDYGCSIPGTPIKVDLEIGDSYAFQEYKAA